jgi:hypothetical protein
MLKTVHNNINNLSTQKAIGEWGLQNCKLKDRRSKNNLGCAAARQTSAAARCPPGSPAAMGQGRKGAGRRGDGW